MSTSVQPLINNTFGCLYTFHSEVYTCTMHLKSYRQCYLFPFWTCMLKERRKNWGYAFDISGMHGSWECELSNDKSTKRFTYIQEQQTWNRKEQSSFHLLQDLCFRYNTKNILWWDSSDNCEEFYWGNKLFDIHIRSNKLRKNLHHSGWVILNKYFDTFFNRLFYIRAP